MHSHSFQNTELKLYRYVNDSQVQVAGRVTILPYPPEGSRIKGYSLKKRKFDMQLHSFQDTALKLLTHVKDFQEQVVEGLTILRDPRGLENKGLITQKTEVAWPPTTVAWPFSDFFKKFPNCLKRPKNVVWQSVDGRMISDYCPVAAPEIHCYQVIARSIT